MFNTDFKYIIDYDIDGYRDCENHGCEDEGICRCYTITDIIINNIDVLKISKSIYDDIFLPESKEYKRNTKLNQLLFNYNPEVDLYCIDRILRSNNIYNEESWKSEWSASYYGDEVDSIKIESEIVSKIESDISSLLTLNSLKDKIEFLLIREYGKLVDKIINKNYKIIEVNKKDIVFGQEQYLESIDPTNYYSDKNYNLIKGVCLQDGSKWKVIDGYHRISSSSKELLKIVGIYEN